MTMTNLSPAAQAVLAASHTDPQVVADILLAAADQVVPEFAHDDDDVYGETMQDVRRKLLAIADELEAQ
jgi:hypothetical protein